MHFYTLTEQSQMEPKKTIPSKRAEKIILKNKPNKEGERFVHWKLPKHHWKKLEKTQINRQASHVHGLEDLILLRCPY